MKFENTTLDNGLQIIAEVNDEAFSQSLGYFVKTGSRDEVPDMGGVSHFLEHMVFKGTDKRSAEDVNRELDELGAQSNAYTCEDQTVYYMSILPDQQTQAVDLLTDLMRPALRTSDFETEKNVILEEIAMYDDAPPYGSMERCMESFYGDHPLSIRVLGTPQTVSDLDSESMREYHQDRYAPDNLCLVATGAVDFDALVKQAEILTKSWKPSGFKRVSTMPKHGSAELQFQHAPAVQQYTFELSQGVSRNDPRRHAYRLLATVLGDDSGSRAFWALVDPGLAESAGMFAHEYDECGILGLFLTCTPEDTQANWDALVSIVREETGKKITERELTVAKNKICSSLVLSSERPGNRLFTVGNAMTMRGVYETVDQSIANYRRVTLDAVHDAWVDYVNQGGARVTIGPELDVLK
ncbi:MAG: pitrilysin family protein [Planctomycetota bacterium]|nr:pitrilysin family protein [Planctomycetota bacterium]